MLLQSFSAHQSVLSLEAPRLTPHPRADSWGCLWRATEQACRQMLRFPSLWMTCVSEKRRVRKSLFRVFIGPALKRNRNEPGVEREADSLSGKKTSDKRSREVVAGWTTQRTKLTVDAGPGGTPE